MPSLGVVAFTAVGWFFAGVFFVRCRSLSRRLHNLKEFKSTTMIYAAADTGKSRVALRKERP